MTRFTEVFSKLTNKDDAEGLDKASAKKEDEIDINELDLSELDKGNKELMEKLKNEEEDQPPAKTRTTKAKTTKAKSTKAKTTKAKTTKAKRRRQKPSRSTDSQAKTIPLTISLSSEEFYKFEAFSISCNKKPEDILRGTVIQYINNFDSED